MRRLRVRSIALFLAVALAISVDAARSSVTFLSDKYIEAIAARLKLPEGGPTITLPATLDARRSEHAAVLAEAQSWTEQLAAREAEAFAALPGLLEAFGRLQALPLAAAERRALAQGGLEALPADKQAPFTEAAPAAAAAQPILAAYFDAYDAAMRSQIRARILGLTLTALEAREALEGHLGKRAAAKFDARIAAMVESERLYRAFMAHPKAKNHHRALAALVCQRRGAGLNEDLDTALGKAGLAPKKPWKERLAAIGRSVRSSLRAAKICTACLPGAARIVAYLYNPFRREPDPKKAARALRALGRCYQWGAGMKLAVTGTQNVPTDHPVIFAFSHRSELEDAVIMFAVASDEYSFLVGQWAMPSFLNDKLAAEPTSINVGGKKPDGTTVDAIEESVAALRAGRDLLIYPEGMTPTDHGETQPLRAGVDVIAGQMAEQPVSVVAVTFADPANGYDGPRHKSVGGKIRVAVNFSQPLDPLKLRSIPGAEPDLLRHTIRALWHRNLFGPAATGAGPSAEHDIPAADQAERFDGLHDR